MPAFSQILHRVGQPIVGSLAALTFGSLLIATSAMASGKLAPGDACQEVKFSDLGDSVLVAKTSAAAVVLQALGYKPESFRLTPAETTEALIAGKIDVFLGADLRTPKKAETTKKTPAPKAKPDTGPLENLSVNQEFPLGPPVEVAAVPLDEVGDEVGDKTAEKPSGTEDAATAPLNQLHTGFVSQARSGFSTDCPNLAKFIKNLSYTIDMLRFIETQVTQEFEEPFDAAVNWFADNPQQLARWLDGVVTFNGGNAAERINTEFAF